jgi:RNA polymerase sigma factor (TIGR02999 family)
MSEVTRILSAIEQGDPQAAERLLPLVYDELRKLAAAKLAQEKPDQTLEATALVHAAYLRLVGVAEPQVYRDRRHFFAAAAGAMRRILIDQARRKQSDKRGGGRRRPLRDPPSRRPAGHAISGQVEAGRAGPDRPVDRPGDPARRPAGRVHGRRREGRVVN